LLQKVGATAVRRARDEVASFDAGAANLPKQVARQVNDKFHYWNEYT
jgi:hypothetical protein